jgi:hypothetical protein
LHNQACGAMQRFVMIIDSLKKKRDCMWIVMDDTLPDSLCVGITQRDKDIGALEKLWYKRYACRA